MNNRNRLRSLLATQLGALLVAALVLPALGSADAVLGTPGSGAGQMKRPRGVAADIGLGRVYVGDSENQRIDVFNAASGAFVMAFGWGVADGVSNEFQTCTTTCFAGIAGSGSGQFREPRDLALDSDPASPSFHDLYVVDSNNERVQKFTPAGEFILTFGDEVNKTTGEDLCTAASGDTCGRGNTGEGEGQFNGLGGITAAAGGVVYAADQVGEPPNRKSRIQKYSPAGAYLGQLVLDAGVDVGATTTVAVDSGGNLLVGTAGPTGAVRKYSAAGTCLNCGSPIDPSLNVTAITIDGSDQLFIADNTGASTVLEYNSAEVLQRAYYGPLSRNVPVNGLAFLSNANGDIFAAENSGRVAHISFPPPGPIVYPGAESVFASPIGNVKATLHAEVNPEGKATTFHFQYVDQKGFEEGGFASPAVEETTESGPIGSDFDLHGVQAQVSGLTPETVYHFRAIATNADAPAGNFGPEASFETAPPLEIGSLWSTEVGTDAATLHAEVNPLGLAATGFFEYVDDASFAASGFDTASKAPAGEPLDFGSAEVLTARSAQIFALSPRTTYHYRLIASDHCKPAEPSVLCSFETAPRTFTTFALSSPPSTECPANAAFRTGPAGFLADCRGYEMVSPVDKNGANVEPVFNVTGFPASLDQSATDGQSLTYSAYRAFGDPEASPYSSQYLASRTAEGWNTESISPRREGPTLYNTAGLDYQFKAFTSDLCLGWPLQDTALSLAPGSVPGYPNLYRRDNCEPGAAAYQTVTTVKPPNLIPRDFRPELQGFSADGSRAFFRAADKLTPDARAGINEVYETSGGALRLVCVLPNGTAAGNDCSVGMPSTLSEERSATLSHAVSADGSRVYWTESSNAPGPLYVRVEGKETIPVAVADARFWTASTDGAKAFYSVRGNFFEFDLATKASTLIAEGFNGLAGAGDDGSRLYFVSTKSLAAGGIAGQFNLYLDQAGTFTFIAALSALDVPDQARPSPVAAQPVNHSSRVTPDGDHLVFMSNGSLTGYDNTDAVSGKPDAEVFLFDATANAGAGLLVCVSCNPSNERPTGRKWNLRTNEGRFAAATITTGENQLYSPRVISDDGSRLFFNSTEGLIARDTNRAQDVYEWEAPGSGDCTDASPDLQPTSGGCLSLISSGEDPGDSELVDSSAGGGDVFFKTSSGLVPQDPGLLDIYDARVDGGFAPPPPAPIECEGEACQHPGPAPEDPAPASSTFVGPGNPVSTPSRHRRCPKGTHRVKKHGKVRCVKARKGSKHKQGRAAR